MPLNYGLNFNPNSYLESNIRCTCTGCLFVQKSFNNEEFDDNREETKYFTDSRNQEDGGACSEDVGSGKGMTGSGITGE